MSNQFLGQLAQFGGNVVGGLLNGQGFAQARPQWPATDPQNFARQEAEQWIPTLTQPTAASPAADAEPTMNTGDASLNQLLKYADFADRRSADNARNLLAIQNQYQKEAANNFTIPALMMKGQFGILQAMATKDKYPINGLGWLPNPQGNVIRHPLG